MLLFMGGIWWGERVRRAQRSREGVRYYRENYCTIVAGKIYLTTLPPGLVVIAGMTGLYLHTGTYSYVSPRYQYGMQC